MQVHSAIMLSEEDVANHNSPTLLLAASEEALLEKVRTHIADNSDWRDAMDGHDVAVLSIDDINEVLCDADPGLFVHTDVAEL